MRSELTAYPPTDEKRACTYCGETEPVRVIDNDGYAPNELICEDCFSHDVMCWGDLPAPKWPREEQ